MTCVICNTKFTPCSPVSFHKFPKDKEQKKRWLEACIRYKHKIKYMAYPKICSKHFTLDSFRHEQVKELGRNRILKADAVPSLFLDKHNSLRSAGPAPVTFTFVACSPPKEPQKKTNENETNSDTETLKSPEIELDEKPIILEDINPEVLHPPPLEDVIPATENVQSNKSSVEETPYFYVKDPKEIVARRDLETSIVNPPLEYSTIPLQNDQQNPLNIATELDQKIQPRFFILKQGVSILKPKTILLNPLENAQHCQLPVETNSNLKTQLTDVGNLVENVEIVDVNPVILNNKPSMQHNSLSKTTLSSSKMSNLIITSSETLQTNINDDLEMIVESDTTTEMLNRKTDTILNSDGQLNLATSDCETLPIDTDENPGVVELRSTFTSDHLYSKLVEGPSDILRSKLMENKSKTTENVTQHKQVPSDEPMMTKDATSKFEGSILRRRLEESKKPNKKLKRFHKSEPAPTPDLGAEEKDLYYYKKRCMAQEQQIEKLEKQNKKLRRKVKALNDICWLSKTCYHCLQKENS